MKVILSFFLFLLIGCSQPKNRNIIAPNNGKYWDVIRNRDKIYKTPVYCYYFRSNGDCIYFNYSFVNGKGKRNVFDYGDVIYPNTWKLKIDTLEIQGFDYLIKNINKDSIIMVLAGKPFDTLVLSSSIYQ